MLTAAYSIFLANLVFGILVKRRIVDSSRFRIAHHLLYFLVMAGILAAIVIAIIGGSSSAWPLAGMAALLLGMTRFRGRSRGHWIYATFCCAVYSAIVLWQ